MEKKGGGMTALQKSATWGEMHMQTSKVWIIRVPGQHSSSAKHMLYSLWARSIYEKNRLLMALWTIVLNGNRFEVCVWLVWALICKEGTEKIPAGGVKIKR